MNKLLLFFFLSGISLSWAQEIYNTSGLSVSGSELEASTFENDSTANAFYIFEQGVSKFQVSGNFNLITDYSAKIKILNQDGYKHANIEIRLYKNPKNKEKISKLEAITYKIENGQKKAIKLEPSAIYTIEENENFNLVKFTFPSISPGAVLVYSYQKESPFIFNYEPWWFQGEIPKLYSVYETSIPGNYNYNIKKVGELKLDLNTSEIKKRCFQPTASASAGDCVVSVYGMKNIPAFKEEPYLTSKFNYISRIVYELMEITSLDGSVKKYTKTWKDVDKEIRYDKNLGKQLQRSALIKEILPEAFREQDNDLSKAKSIFDYVKKNYTWNGDYRIYSDMNLKDLLKNKTGNVSSINILLHNLYEDQGFLVKPVMSSTRNNGLPTKLYPVLSEFNYLMVQLEVEDKKYLLDATEKNLDFGDIPFRSLNEYGRLIDFKNEGSWVDIIPENFSTIYFKDSIKVSADGTSSGQSQQVFTGYHALSRRDNLDKLSNSDIFTSVSNPANFTKSISTTLKNKDSVSEALHINYVLENETQKINDAIYFNPFSFKFFKNNPFKSEKRNYPIDFGYKDSYYYTISVEIPENYKVVELPKQKLLSLPESGGSLSFVVQQADERNINVQYRISFPKSSYSSGYYPYLKEFFNSIIEVQSQTFIVMKEII